MLALDSVVTTRTIKTRLGARTRFEAIQELLDLLVLSADLPMRRFGRARDAVFRTERVRSSGTASGVAVPYGILEGLPTPLAAIGLSEEGIDFGGAEPSRLVVLLLYPQGSFVAEHGMFPAVVELTRSAEDVARLVEAGTSVELEKRLEVFDQKVSAHS